MFEIVMGIDDFLIQLVKYWIRLNFKTRSKKNMKIVFDNYLGKWNYTAVPKVKT